VHSNEQTVIGFIERHGKVFSRLQGPAFDLFRGAIDHYDLFQRRHVDIDIGSGLLELE